MKYLCMVINEEKRLDAMPRAEFQALVEEHRAYDDVLRESGHYLVSNALESVETATTVRVRNGRCRSNPRRRAAGRGPVIVGESRIRTSPCHLQSWYPSQHSAQRLMHMSPKASSTKSG